MNIGNPFQYGRELGTNELVDREEEIGRIIRTVENRGKLFLIGPRRYGKTSVLKAAGDTLGREGTVVLRFDVEAYESPGRLAEAMLTAAGRALTGPIDRISRALQHLFGTLKPEVSVGPDQTLSVTIGRHADAGVELPTLVEVLDGIERLAAEDDRLVAVILDEFQSLIEADETAERRLRAVVQRHRHVAYVFAGSNTRLMEQMTGSPTRPFFKLGDRLFLGKLPHEEFTRFLETGFEKAGFATDASALRAILERAEEIPYNVQQLAHECWEQLRASEADRLIVGIVDRALEQIVRASDPFYTKLWTGITPPQQRAVRAVIERHGRQLFSQDASREYGMPVATMQSALERLLQRGIVREEAEQGTIRYRLEDPFFGAWLELVQSAT